MHVIFPIQNRMPRRLRTKGGFAELTIRELDGDRVACSMHPYSFLLGPQPRLGNIYFFWRASENRRWKCLEKLLVRFGKFLWVRTQLCALLPSSPHLAGFKWKIDFDLLVAAVQLLETSCDRFEEVLEKSRNEKEFKMFARLAKGNKS